MNIVYKLLKFRLRAKQKVISSIKVKPSNQQRMRVFPTFFKTVFLHLLSEMKFEVIQCQLEAEAEIDALARGIKCPVISNDSDFYVMDVALIPLSSMDFTGVRKPLATGYSYAISCQIFEISDFLKWYYVLVFFNFYRPN